MGNHYSVYRLVFPDGMQYVGVTGSTIEYRRDCGYGHNPRLKQAIHDCGWANMGHEILQSGLAKDEAFALEQRYISEFESADPEKGYNISHGGKSTFAGLHHTESAKEKIRRANTGRTFSAEHRRNLSNSLKGVMVGEKNPNYGKPKTPEIIKKQYDSHRHEMKPIIQKNLDGVIVASYDSLHQAEKATGIARQSITKAIHRKAKHAGGFLWEYLNGGDVG